MITTIFSINISSDRAIFAINLAAAVTRNLRKVALVDLTASMHSLHWKVRRSAADQKARFAVHDPLGLPLELENRNSYLRTHYNDIIIDTDGADSWFTEAAMAASQLIIVPFWFHQDNRQLREKLIERIDRIRLFHPALRIMVVDMQRASAQSDAEVQQYEAATAFANAIPGAILSDVVMHEWFGARRAFDDGFSIFEDSFRDERAEAEMQALCRTMRHINTAPVPIVDSTAVTQAIQRIIRPQTPV